MAAPKRPLVSFIVPVRNDAARLERCLASIRAADYPADLVEIVVADNGSTDGSDRVARAAGADVLVLPDVRVADLRNAAVKKSHGSIVAFVDADHEIARDWTESAVETLQTVERAAAVGAAYEAPSNGTWVQTHYDSIRRRQPGIREVEWLGSGNVALWREVFERAGGFDTRLHTCEDVDLCQRIRAAGGRIMSDSRLKTVHFGNPKTLGELFKGELWRGRDNVRVSLRPPVSLRSIASLLVPALHLVLIAVGCVGLIGSPALGMRGLALTAVAILGTLTLASVQSVRMLPYGPSTGVVSFVRTIAVAWVYGMARALALVVRVPHRVRQRGAR